DLGVGLCQLRLVLFEQAIRADDVLEGRHEQVEDLLLLGGDGEPAPEKQDLHADANRLLGAQTTVLGNASDAPHQVCGRARVGDEVVCPALEPLDDVQGGVEGGE